MPLNLRDPEGHDELRARITVFGVGGAGGNAVNNMIEKNLEGVEFVAGNTDAQALGHSKAARTIQLGVNVTRGLGAGSKPDVGFSAAEESFDFLGFTFHKRWSRTHRGVKYYHVQASMKAMKAVRANIKDYLKSHLHQGRDVVIRNLNWKVRGWLAYFVMPGTTQSWKAADMLKGYLKDSLFRYYRRKSQRYNTRKIQNAFYVWNKYGLIDPMQYCKAAAPKA